MRYAIDFDGEMAAKYARPDLVDSEAASVWFLEDLETLELVEEYRRDILDTANADAAWIKRRLVENAMLAREEGKYAESNRGFELVGRHDDTQAFTNQRVQVLPAVIIRDHSGGRIDGSVEIVDGETLEALPPGEPMEEAEDPF